MRLRLAFFIALGTLISCESSPSNIPAQDEPKEVVLSPQELADDLLLKVQKNAKSANLDSTLFIDHGRLAQEVGVKKMGPSEVMFFSNPTVNVQLVQQNPLAALDLPYRILAYKKPGNDSVRVAFASSAYFKSRHGIDSDEVMKGYEKDSESLIMGMQSADLSPVEDVVEYKFGVIELISDYNFDETVQRIKDVIMAQEDTKWFGVYDFKSEAESFNVQIPNETLLLFGGPGPGGVAMADYPKLGLDAFCQKMLVYEDGNGKVYVAFNDIAAFANLHYGKNIEVHEKLNQRIKATMLQAISAAS